MRKLDRRGAAALEFVLAILPLLCLIFVIFDLGRYAITMQSLRALANAGARAVMIDNCFTTDLLQQKSPSSCFTNCTGDPLPTGKQNWAPFLYFEGLNPTLNVSCTTQRLTVTAQANKFQMLTSIWGVTLNAPSASTTIPTF
jgi:Flp pilus assembly protein TadG